MRRARLLAPWRDNPEGPPAVYHCVSRVVDRRRVFGTVEKEHFVRLMRRYERFCGVRVLTYTVMSNHFHLEVEVPPRPVEGLTQQQLLERLLLIKRQGEVAQVERQLDERREAGDEAGVAAIMERYLYRMWDLSEFMKSLLQCFTKWFNQRHQRTGTLWEGRFKSSLVQGGYAARVVGAYIDLNPVRAGMENGPERYRWSGYAEAVAGGTRAREGITRLVEQYERLGGVGREQRGWKEISAAYRKLLYHDGEERVRENPATGKLEVVRRGFASAEVDAVLEDGGHLPLGAVLRCRLRALVEGAVIGSQAFVEELSRAERERWGGKRQKEARPVNGSGSKLFTLRALR